MSRLIENQEYRNSESRIGRRRELIEGESLLMAAYMFESQTDLESVRNYLSSQSGYQHSRGGKRDRFFKKCFGGLDIRVTETERWDLESESFGNFTSRIISGKPNNSIVLYAQVGEFIDAACQEIYDATGVPVNNLEKSKAPRGAGTIFLEDNQSKLDNKKD